MAGVVIIVQEEDIEIRGKIAFATAAKKMR
jgi:hypothetical protein